MKMQKYNRISYLFIVILVIGLLFQNQHWPFAGILLLLSSVFSLVMLVVKAIALRHHDLYKENLIVHTTTLILLNYIVFRFMFFGFTKMIFPMILLASILSVIVLFSKKYKILSEWVVLGVFFILTIGFTQLRSHQIYYYKSQRILTEKGDYVRGSADVFDRYAWYLNSAKKYNEAEVAMEKALVRFDADQEGDEPLMINLTREELLNHQELLKKREWKNFP